MAVRGVIESGTTLDFTRYTVRLDIPDLQANHAFARVFHPFPPEDEVPTVARAVAHYPPKCYKPASKRASRVSDS